MMYQEIKFKTRQQPADQSGVSLLMAILVLAALTAISFSISGIIRTEIRASSDLTSSETAIYAATAITEEALFKAARHAPLTYTTTIGQVSLTSTEETLNTVPYVDVVSATVTKQYNFVDPENPNGDGGYGGAKVVYVSVDGPALTVELWEINPNPPQGETGRTKVSETVLQNTNDEWSKLDMDPTKQYELLLINGDPALGVSVNVYSYDEDHITPKGLPYVGEVVVNILARYLGLTRKYFTRIPQ